MSNLLDLIDNRVHSIEVTQVCDYFLFVHYVQIWLIRSDILKFNLFEKYFTATSYKLLP